MNIEDINKLAEYPRLKAENERLRELLHKVYERAQANGDRALANYLRVEVPSASESERATSIGVESDPAEDAYWTGSEPGSDAEGA